MPEIPARHCKWLGCEKRGLFAYDFNANTMLMNSYMFFVRQTISMSLINMRIANSLMATDFSSNRSRKSATREEKTKVEIAEFIGEKYPESQHKRRQKEKGILFKIPLLKQTWVSPNLYEMPCRGPTCSSIDWASWRARYLIRSYS